MMRTIIKCIDMGAMLFQVVLHVRMECPHRVFVIVAAGDPGLICNDENVVSGLVQKAHRFGRSLDPYELLGLVRIAAVDFTAAVAINKYRGTEISFLVRVNRRCLVTHWLSPGTYLDDRVDRQPLASRVGVASR